MAPPLVTPLSRFSAAALGVNLKADRASAGLRGRPAAGEVEAPAFELSDNFTYQSYFDDTLLARAILAAPSNQPIIPSTMPEKPIQVSGYAIGLHPSSECPVAVIMQTGAQQGASQAYRLKPGDVVRPQGTKDGQPGSFSGFTWGLPFGWLGGGMAKLIIMRTPDAEVFWTGNPEIIFHRARFAIVSLANAPAAAANVPLNWPKRFPWPNALFGSNSIRQSGQPALGVTPTRTAVRLRVSTLAAPATMRMAYCGSNDFGVGSNGAADRTDIVFHDLTWGTYIQGVGIAGPGTYYPSQMLTGQPARFACDDGGLVLLALTASLEGQFCDIVRYGTL